MLERSNMHPIRFFLPENTTWASLFKAEIANMPLMSFMNQAYLFDSKLQLVLLPADDGSIVEWIIGCYFPIDLNKTWT